MVALILFLVLVAILFGAGAVVPTLWWIAVIALAVWLAGFALRPGGGRGRWYYW